MSWYIVAKHSMQGPRLAVPAVKRVLSRCLPDLGFCWRLRIPVVLPVVPLIAFDTVLLKVLKRTVSK